MKVKYQRVQDKDYVMKEFEYTYQFPQIDVCCDKMKEALKEWVIVFGNDFTRYGNEHYHNNLNNKINIYKTVRSNYDRHDLVELVTEISFCPFCGEKIIYDKETEVIK